MYSPSQVNSSIPNRFLMLKLLKSKLIFKLVKTPSLCSLLDHIIVTIEGITKLLLTYGNIRYLCCCLWTLCCICF
ncbi:unnamed protein product [Moneuplotes crassus]|uniref:Uncharacterized protein n=1 Tax=Euplotes crassus TaxID=5936 RepID=A0AAD1XYB4_EUPCR|nr:unnamed protein product [Moneuplotes crassus]